MKKEKQLIKRTVIFLLISSLALIIAAFDYEDSDVWRLLAPIAVSAVFWVFLALGYVCFYKLSSLRKRYERENGSSSKKRRPGIIVFFSNRYAVAADIFMVISILVFIVFQFDLFGVGESQSFFASLGAMLSASALLFSAQMHCILNGINFQYITGKDKKERIKPVEGGNGRHVPDKPGRNARRKRRVE